MRSLKTLCTCGLGGALLNIYGARFTAQALVETGDLQGLNQQCFCRAPESCEEAFIDSTT